MITGSIAPTPVSKEQIRAAQEALTDFGYGNLEADGLFGPSTSKAIEAFEQANPKEARAINRKIKRLLGGAWELWWLKTPIDGVVWCNAPHMTGFDGVDPADMTAAEFAARDRITEAVDYVRANLPGFENCYMLDVASQMGVRQTRLLEGEYVMTKEDVTSRRHFADTVARGRDYYYPFRSLLPKEVDQLLVAGRHYSATPEAQKMSREIPPCMAMGQAVGVAAALAIQNGTLVRDVSALDIQQGMRRHGADPGDVPSSNATLDVDAVVGA